MWITIEFVFIKGKKIKINRKGGKYEIYVFVSFKSLDKNVTHDVGEEDVRRRIEYVRIERTYKRERK